MDSFTLFLVDLPKLKSARMAGGWGGEQGQRDCRKETGVGGDKSI